MSREIKFRAWDTKQRYMLQKSVLVFTHSVGTSVMLNLKHSEVPYLPGKNWYRDNFHNYYSDDGSVIPMQYTGLKDKNGREIYEGDICRAYKPNSYLDGTYAVVWDEKHGRWAYNYETRPMRSYQVGSAGNLVCEIIGNIYEHPELLEKS